jgi:hypothetical protein
LVTTDTVCCLCQSLSSSELRDWIVALGVTEKVATIGGDGL